METPLLQQSNPSHSEKDIRLVHIYETYCLWKSLPALFKYPPVDKAGSRPAPREFAEQMGIDDENILSLVDIKTQTQFAERFDVSPDTLTDWNKTLKVRNTSDDLRGWAKHLTKNVMLSLYNTCVRRGWAIDAKLWLQYVEQWQEKSQVTHGLGDIHFNITLNKKPDGNKLGAVSEADRSVGASA